MSAIVAIVIIAAGMTSWQRAIALAPPSNAFPRAARIERSIGVWRWFNRPATVDDEHYADYVSDTDLQRLHAMGFTAVRLPVGTEFLFGGDANYGRLRTDRLAFLDAAIARINAAGMVVVVDFHPRASIKSRLEREPELVKKTVDFWRLFAAHLSATDPEKVLLELLNEPRFARDDRGWNRVSHQLWQAARAGAPRHTLIVSSAYYGSVDRLSSLEPVNDTNVIYTVHFYEPMKFTSQGARFLPGLAGLPWPGAGQQCDTAARNAPLAITRPDSKDSPHDWATAYCAGGWDETKLRAQVAEAGRWSRENHTPVWVGEFGVRAQDAAPADRLRWLRAATSAFTAERLPWSLWSYDDCFGLGLGRGIQCQSKFAAPQPQVRFVCTTLSAIGMGNAVCPANQLSDRLGKTSMTSPVPKRS
ncbi:glycoside hydrolase family 5 protein [Sphingomonas sp. Leaf25]|uniref:glycoside hydrolase family 5 protein n=1 Tax=Sphingomonas sp. Leaf25 TaxID=1735692 RepID=UPI000715B0B1|nr:cellulase family glycosylhydrolase [Sphingomonas sp. Leaf25]KQN04302.1 hypothetical protein ASE78_17180 [Sphingomonas sp. Leaf25]